MMNRFTMVLALMASVALAAPVQAQQADDHEVRQELRSMTTDADAEADRAVIQDFLQRDDVQRAAEQAGLDIERAADGVPALSDDQAAQVAQNVVDVQAALAGGDTLVITSTTIVIILLILLLLAL